MEMQLDPKGDFFSLQFLLQPYPKMLSVSVRLLLYLPVSEGLLLKKNKYEENVNGNIIISISVCISMSISVNISIDVGIRISVSMSISISINNSINVKTNK